MDIDLPPDGSGPDVVVGHAWWGRVAAVTDYAKALAARGFVVSTPDLFAGHRARTVAEAEALVQTEWHAAEKLADAIRKLAAHPAVTTRKVGLVGFSYSGWAAIGLAGDITLPLGGTVVYYASRMPATPHGPILAHLAAHDPFESEDSMAAMSRALADAGPPNAAYRHAGTTHWFAEPHRPEYVSGDAMVAFDRTVSFLTATVMA